ncbi:hypothetical protein ACQY0O_005825 [Thecaphora frezii]
MLLAALDSPPFLAGHRTEFPFKDSSHLSTLKMPIEVMNPQLCPSGCARAGRDLMNHDRRTKGSNGTVVASPATMLVSKLLAFPLMALAASGAICKRAVDPSNFQSRGLVAIGQFPADLRDSTGQTLGGLGSAASLVPDRFARKENKYAGSVYLQPDRGYNVEETIDYTAHHHRFDFEFEEYTGSANLSFSNAIRRFQLKYRSTLLYHEAIAQKRLSTRLDPALNRKGGLTGTQANAPLLGAANGTINKAREKISIDAEGFVANPDGTFWTSDEYGPYIYKLAADGTILAYIALPAAVIPRIDGQVNFTSE